MQADADNAEIERLLVHSEWLSALARRLVRDPATADDLVQDTWLAALRTPRGDELRERGWLATVLANLARSRSRGERARGERERRAASGELVDGPEALVLRAESQRRLLTHVLALEEPYRGTLLSRYIEGVSAAEIARRSGVNEGTVRMRISRALERLRARLAAEQRADPLLGLGVLLVEDGAIAVSNAALAATGGWIVSTTTKTFLAALVLVGAWLAWRGMRAPDEARSSPMSVTEDALAPAPTPANAVNETIGELSERQARSIDGAPVLRVHVVALESRTPLAGVPVRAFPALEREGWSFDPIGGARGTMHEIPLSAADGVAEFEVRAGAPLLVTAGGGTSGASYAELAVAALEDAERREVTLELRSDVDRTFCARVVDETTRAPVAGARVRLQSGAVPASQARELLTDADGRFSLLVESWTNVSLTLGAVGFASAWIVPVAQHGTPETAFQVVLARPAMVRLRLLDRSGSPIAGARVTAKVARYKLMQPPDDGMRTQSFMEDDFFAARSDAGGIAVLADLPPRVGIELSASLLRDSLRADPNSFTLQPAEVRDLTWRMGTGCRVFGSVRSTDDSSVEGQEMWLVPLGPRMAAALFFGPYEQDVRKTRCDSDGAFEFLDVPPGSWLVGPAAVRNQDAPWKDGLVAPFARLFEIPAGATESRVDIVLARDLAIRGSVEDPEGKPIAQVLVSATHVESNATSMCVSESDGSFALGPLVPGSYRVSAGGLGSPPQTLHIVSREVLVDAGASGLVLRLQSGCSLAGRVVDDASGASVAAQLTLVPMPGQEDLRIGWWPLSTDANGGFLARGLKPASYAISACTTSGRVGYLKPIAISAGEQRTGLEIRVVPGAALRVFYEGPDRFGQAQILVDGVVLASEGFERGARRNFTVPAGRSTARGWRVAGEPVDLELELKAGETRELAFDGAWK